MTCAHGDAAELIKEVSELLHRVDRGGMHDRLGRGRSAERFIMGCTVETIRSASGMNDDSRTTSREHHREDAGEVTGQREGHELAHDLILALDLFLSLYVRIDARSFRTLTEVRR